MSTRGTVTVREDGAVLGRFYHHMDSYPDGLGRELAEFIESGRFVNGIGLGSGGLTQFNGAGCFAAALIAKLKDGPGGVYMIAKSQVEEYNYTIDIVDHSPGPEIGKLRANVPPVVSITVRAGRKEVFKGTARQLLEWLKTPADKEA
jgi:hypothetical protein